MVKVRDVMTKGIVSVPPAARRRDALAVMEAAGSDIVAVCERGKFRGIVTARRLAMVSLEEGEAPESTEMRKLADKGLPIIQPGADIIQAIRLMVRRGVDMLPVAQNGRLLGLFRLENLLEGVDPMELFLAALTYLGAGDPMERQSEAALLDSGGEVGGE